MANQVEIKENCINIEDNRLLGILLKDKTSGRNIIWATDTYLSYGVGFAPQDYMTKERISGWRGYVIKPLAEKSEEEQRRRIRNRGEVLTPTWICNKQNNLIDNAWFGRENVFNTENKNGWTVNSDKAVFPNTEGRSWRDYVKAPRLEITCGEAPYLTSRYDTVTGSLIEIENRIGLLDRKLRVVSENTQTEKDWYKWAVIAFKSIYGFDFQGDNVLIARENLLFTFIDAYKNKFEADPPKKYLVKIAGILAWNIWQMDGLKYVIPYSCTPCRNLQVSIFDSEKERECEGCAKNDNTKHIGIYCKIMNWDRRRAETFISLSAGDILPSIKFDAIVGNPPYQVMDGGAQASAMPIYNSFVDCAKRLTPGYISMIMPARWYAGGKGLDSFRQSMISDNKIARLIDYSDSADCFPSLGERNIKGGICYFLRDANHNGECFIESMSGNECVAKSKRFLKEEGCEIFIRDAVGISVLNKVREKTEKAFSEIVSSRKPFDMATNFGDFDEEKTNENQCIIYALRKIGYIDRNKVARNADWIDKYKLFIPEAIGNADVASDTVKPIVGEKGTCCTETYLVVGPFDGRKEMLNCLSYINTRFFHFLLSLKKITQHTTRKCYEFIPMQDFSEGWNDGKLFEKYNLTEDEIKYINNTVWVQKGVDKNGDKL